MSMQDALLNGREAETRLILAAYHAIESDLKAEAAAARRQSASTPVEAVPELVDADDASDETAVGWVPRLREVAGIAADRLGPLHGQLIALGLLKFQLTGRTSGIVYRISHEGRVVLQQATNSTDADWSEQSAA